MQSKLLSEYWQEAKAVVKAATERRKAGLGPELSTGLPTLDELTGGITRSHVWVVSGRPGSGKTALAMQMARRCADDPKNSVLFLSLEMRPWELVLRMYCEMIGHNYGEIIMGRAEIPENEDMIYEKYLNNIDFELVEHGYNFKEVKEVIKSHYGIHKPDVIFLDYIQLVDYSSFTDQREGIVSYIRDLKEMAVRDNVAFVVISQLRRMPSGSDMNRPPDLQDLMGSGSLEQTADKVLFIYKNLIKNSVLGDRYEWNLNLAKNRQGRTAEFKVIFKGENYRFEDIL